MIVAIIVIGETREDWVQEGTSHYADPNHSLPLITPMCQLPSLTSSTPPLHHHESLMAECS